MFEFRFLDDPKDVNQVSEHSEEVTLAALESKEIKPDTNIIADILNADCVHTLKLKNSVSIKHITSDVVKIISPNSSIQTANETASDLITGQYEGGLKIWECTYDLINYIQERRLDLSDRVVLDLGCGAGIIGILASLNNSKVYFQDYNEDVIKYITIPNVFLNSTDQNTAFDKCKFYSGDWASFPSITSKNFESDNSKFDYIFTCETIYNTKNYEKLHQIFEKQLKKTGIIYLAAKTYYFGVGGGLRQFEDFLTEKNVFNFTTCWRYSEGVQREILKIVFKS